MKALVFGTDDWQEARVTEIVPNESYLTGLVGRNMKVIALTHGAMAIVDSRPDGHCPNPAFNRVLIHTAHPESEFGFVRGPAVVLGVRGSDWADVPDAFVIACAAVGVHVQTRTAIAPVAG